GQAALLARFALQPGTYQVEVRYSSGVRRAKEITVAGSPVPGGIDDQTPRGEGSVPTILLQAGSAIRSGEGIFVSDRRSEPSFSRADCQSALRKADRNCEDTPVRIAQRLLGCLALLAAALVVETSLPTAHAYIGGPPQSLGMMCSWSTHVMVVRVEKF